MSPRVATAALGALMLGALAGCSSPTRPSRPPTTAVRPPPTGCPAVAPALNEEGLELQGSPLGLSVERLCLYGVDDETRAMVEGSLTLKVGQPLSAEAASLSLDRITKLELFEDVRLGAEALVESALVYVVVVARPLIDNVVFEPATVRPPFELADLGRRADPRRLRAVAAQMEDELHKKGHGGAKVSMTLEPTTAGAARVRVTTDAGPAWTIGQVLFPGAKAIPEAELRTASQLTTGSPWNEEKIGRVGTLLTSLYSDHGLVAAKVGEPAQSVDASGHVTLSWPLDEGAVYTLGKVSFLGKLPEKTQGELRKGMKSRPGAVFNNALVMADVAWVREQLVQRGHKVNVTAISDIDEKKKSIAITLEVSAADEPR